MSESLISSKDNSCWSNISLRLNFLNQIVLVNESFLILVDVRCRKCATIMKITNVQRPEEKNQKVSKSCPFYWYRKTSYWFSSKAEQFSKTLFVSNSAPWNSLKVKIAISRRNIFCREVIWTTCLLFLHILTKLNILSKAISWCIVNNKRTRTHCFSPEPLELQKVYLHLFILVFKELSARTRIFQIRWHD